MVRTLGRMRWLALAAIAIQPAAGATAQELARRTCLEAVEALLPASIAVEEIGSATAGAIRWETGRGDAGTCSIDDSGRLYAIQVERFANLDELSDEVSSSFDPYTVNCSSDRGRRTECPVRSGAVITLDRRYSQTECTQGDTWGVVGDAIWVDDGCRALFRVAPAPDWDPYTVTCNSDRNSRRECSVRAGATVTLSRQMSRTSCTEGHTWGHTGESVWVDDGCRAVFDVRPAGALTSAGSSGSTTGSSGGTTGGSSGGFFSRQAESTCQRHAEAQGYDVRGVRGTNVRAPIYEVRLEVGRSGRELVCVYNSATDEIELR